MLSQPQTPDEIVLALGEREALALLSHEPERRDHFREAGDAAQERAGAGAELNL